MKCTNKEDPPCDRCRVAGIDCTFGATRETKAARVESRLKAVEEHVGAMRYALDELLAMQRRAQAPPPTRLARLDTSPPVFSHQPVSYHVPAQPPPQSTRVWRPYEAHPSSSGSGEPGSGSQSDDEEDGPLEPPAIVYNNMLSLAEAARLRQDGSYEEQGAARVRPRADPAGEGREEDKKKRQRHKRDAIVLAQPLQRGSNAGFKDPVDLGWCSAQEGERLFNVFFDGASDYVPIFDPSDTWESLRERSPFAITALIMVGAKIEDAGKEPSELQKKCKEHAENIGMHTLFTPVARIEVLQAMIVLSMWGDTSWRPGGHALRIAIDMGLYRCLPYLMQSGMGAGKSAAELENERQSVIGARCWLAVYKSEFEMAFNLGRPGLFSAEDTIRSGREFLRHPLTNLADARLVAVCELLTLRMPMHQPFSLCPSTARVVDLDERIADANRSFDRWFAHWDEWYDRRGVPRTNFLRESLSSLHAHAVLHTNSRILHGIRSRRDVAALSPKRAAYLRLAQDSAGTLVHMALRGSSYATNFAKANHYTHVGIAFAARMQIRLASLLPSSVDLSAAARDLELLTERLARVPGFTFAMVIRDVLLKARRRRVLPPAPAEEPWSSRVPHAPLPESSARLEPHPHAALSPVSSLDTTLFSGSPSLEPRHSPRQLCSEAYPFAHKDEHMARAVGNAPPLDFMYAEQLWPRLASPTADADKDFNLDAWFPFPPLDSDIHDSFAL